MPQVGADSQKDVAFRLDQMAIEVARIRAQVEPERLTLAEAEKQHIRAVLELCRGNKREAAEILGVHRRTLDRKGF